MNTITRGKTYKTPYSIVKHLDYAVIGAGVIGLSLGEKLARLGFKVGIFDPRIANALQASENNAGAARVLHWEGPTQYLVDKTIKRFKELGEEIGYKEAGYLWFHDSYKAFRAAVKNAERISKEFNREMPILRGLQQIQNVYPEATNLRAFSFKEPDFGLDINMRKVIGAIHSPNDILFDPNLVCSYYRESALAQGADIWDGFYVYWVQQSKNCQLIYTSFVNPGNDLYRDDQQNSKIKNLMTLSPQEVKNSGKHEKVMFSAEHVIDCRGGWANHLIRQGNSEPVFPQRRQNVCFEAPTPSAYKGFLTLGSTGVYLHPEGNTDKDTCLMIAGNALPHPLDPYNAFEFQNNGQEFFTRHILYYLLKRIGSFNETNLRFKGIYSGLYPQTKDGNCIITEDAIIGPCGHGMMISDEVANLFVAAFVLRDPYALSFISQYHPSRFLPGNEKLWLPYGLHI